MESEKYIEQVKDEKIIFTTPNKTAPEFLLNVHDLELAVDIYV
jgi:hypothetical protein